MSLTLEDAKAIVRAITEDSENSRFFMAGVVMLAPTFSSWDTDDVIAATGYKRSAVEKIISNLVRWGVWGEDHWAGDWPEMFVKGFDALTDKEVEVVTMSFILDSMVGAGDLTREHRDGEFIYSAIRV